MAAAVAKVNEERALGRLAGPFERPPFEVFKCSPLSLRPKSTPGKWRLLHDLSAPYDDNSVNGGIGDDEASVKYPTIADAVGTILSMDSPYLAKADIRDAYRQVPLAPDQYWLVGFELGGVYYHDLRLPMGARSSCAIFERISSALAFILKEHYGVKHIIKMLDDFLFVGETKAECARALDACELLFASLGLPTAPNKTVRPSKRLTFLGIDLDVERGVASIPQEKAEKYGELAQALAKQGSVSLRELREITGKLEHVTAIIKPGRPFLRRLHSAKRGPQRPARRIPMQPHLKADLRTWSLFLQRNNAKTFLRFVAGREGEEVRFWTDASLTGFGGTLGAHCIAGRFPSEWRTLTIEALECYPILALVGTFAPQLANREVVATCDNLPLVHCLTKLSSKNPQVMYFMRPLVLLMLQHNIAIRAEHIASKDNYIADALSRRQVTGAWLERHGKAPELVPIPREWRPEAMLSASTRPSQLRSPTAPWPGTRRYGGASRASRAGSRRGLSQPPLSC